MSAPTSTDPTEQLFEAIKVGDLAAVTALLASDPALVNAPHASGLPPLMLATYFGRKEVVDLLLAKGAGLDIFAAAALGEVEQIDALLRVDHELIGAHSADGWTPLHLAAHFGHEHAVVLLLARGAHVNARSTNAMANTPLHAALAGRHRGVVELLLANGAAVNAQQQGGFTALQAAARHGDPALAELLLDHGADPVIRTDGGKTALAMAIEKGHAAVAELLRRHGAS
jgi:ankyrin repeat protein